MKKLLNVKKIFNGKHKTLIICIIIFLLVMGLLFIFLPGTLSKYVNKSNYGHGFTTSKMIFVSDKLGNPNVETVINNYNYTPITFTISNGLDTESSTGNFAYSGSCSVSEGYTCSFNTSNSNAFSDSITDNNSVQTKTYSITITRTTGTLNDIVLNVHVESSSPYASSLDGTFYIKMAVDNEEPTATLLYNGITSCEYSINNNSGRAKNVKVSISTSSFSFDESNEMFTSKVASTSSSNNYTSITSNIDSYGSKRLIIFKNASTNSCSSSSVTVEAVN